MNPAFEVTRRELQSALRDRRALLSALIFPLLGPVLLALMLALLTKDTHRATPFELHVSGAENAPALVGALERLGARVAPWEEDPVESVRSGAVDTVLVIPDTWTASFSLGEPADLHLVVDSSRANTMANIKRAHSFLRGVEKQMAESRLIARGVDPTLVDVVDVEQLDQATPSTLASGLLDVVVMFLILAAFVCSMHVAIEATAGERERRSLEPLLVNPVSLLQVVLGKWAAGVVFAMGGVAVSLTAIAAMMSSVRLEDLGLRMDFGPGVLLAMLVASVPLALLASALQMMVATFARSFKEAQTYLSLTMLAPMLPGIASVASNGHPPAGSGLVPLVAQQVLLTDLLTGEAVGILRYVESTAGTVAVSAALIGVTVWLFRRERVLFAQ